MPDSINLRINDLIMEYFDGNNSKFADFIGSSEANIRNYRSKTAPSIEVINSICEKLEIRYEWLLAGTGERRAGVVPTKEITPYYVMLNRIEELNRKLGATNQRKLKHIGKTYQTKDKERKAAEPKPDYKKPE